MLVLDTTILVDALRGRMMALRMIEEIEDTDEIICTTQINVLELFKGAYLSNKPDENIKKVKKLLEAFVILSIYEDVFEMFGALSADLRSRKQSIGDFDELIACIAMVNGAAIISSDNHFKRVPGLKVISY
jgi:tRNA(fMet)-specific endonuclease VapC